MVQPEKQGGIPITHRERGFQRKIDKGSLRVAAPRDFGVRGAGRMGQSQAEGKAVDGARPWPVGAVPYRQRSDDFLMVVLSEMLIELQFDAGPPARVVKLCLPSQCDADKSCIYEIRFPRQEHLVDAVRCHLARDERDGPAGFGRIRDVGRQPERDRQKDRGDGAQPDS